MEEPTTCWLMKKCLDYFELKMGSLTELRHIPKEKLFQIFESVKKEATDIHKEKSGLYPYRRYSVEKLCTEMDDMYPKYVERNNENKRPEQAIKKALLSYRARMNAATAGKVLAVETLESVHGTCMKGSLNIFTQTYPERSTSWSQWNDKLRQSILELSKQFRQENGKKLLEEQAKNAIESILSDYKREMREETLLTIMTEEIFEDLHQKILEQAVIKWQTYPEFKKLPHCKLKLMCGINKEREKIAERNREKMVEESQMNQLRRRMNKAISDIDRKMEKRYGENALYAPTEELVSYYNRLSKDVREWFLNQPQTTKVSPDIYMEEIERHCIRKQEHYSQINSAKQVVEESTIMTQKHRKMLQRSCKELVENIELNATFVSALVSLKVIQHSHQEELMNHMVPRSDRVLNLINIIQRRSDEAYGNLRQALKQSNQAHLLKILPK